MTKLLRISLKKPVKLTASFQIKKKNKITIILGMLLLKEVVEDRVEDLVEQTFQIFLRIFLEILEVEEDQEAIEAPIIEVLI